MQALRRGIGASVLVADGRALYRAGRWVSAGKEGPDDDEEDMDQEMVEAVLEAAAEEEKLVTREQRVGTGGQADGSSIKRQHLEYILVSGHTLVLPCPPNALW